MGGAGTATAAASHAIGPPGWQARTPNLARVDMESSRVGPKPPRPRTPLLARGAAQARIHEPGTGSRRDWETAVVAAGEGAPQILEFAVEEYKSLRSMRVPWSSQTVLYGRNGAGKTNLLEAVALCFGSDATLWQVAARAMEPRSGAISALIRCGTSELPLAPAFCIQMAGATSPPGTNTIVDSARFWTMFHAGAEAGRTWEEAVMRLVPDERLAALLERAAQCPLVRFSLESIADLSMARSIDRGLWMRDEFAGGDPTKVFFARRFARTLAIEGPVPDWLVEMAPGLPDQFAPLRRWLSESPDSRSPYPDLLELPPSERSPVRAVWLASERTASDAWFDLSTAFDRADPSVVALGLQLDRLSFAAEDPEAGESEDHPDARFWLVASVADAVNATLSRVFSNLSAFAEDAYSSAIQFYRASATKHDHVIAALDDPHLFEALSSGERTWLDIALAHAAAQLELITATATWLSVGVQRLADEELLTAALELEPDLRVFNEGYWSAEDLTAVIAYMQRLLGSATDVLIGSITEDGDEETRATLEAVYADVMPAVRDALRPILLLHLYDEPERHLHPDAQRRVQQMLNVPVAADVAIATHSHLFLGLAGWRHLHIGATPEGAVLSAFDPGALDLASAVTREMGLTRGELLNRFRYVLFVEGLVDVLVIRGLYGQLFDEAGILILPIHGVDEAASLAEMELFGRIVDIGGGLLVDHARSDRLPPRPLGPNPTKEEQAIHELHRRLKKRGRNLDTFGLRREDIIAYLDERAIQAELPQFPGWAAVHAGRLKNEKLKDAAARLSGQHFGRHLVGRIVERMQSEGIAPGGDLGDRVADIVEAARRGDG